MKDRIVIKKVETLSDDWYILKKTTFDYRRKNGTWQTVSRETYDRGNGATILLYNRAVGVKSNKATPYLLHFAELQPVFDTYGCHRLTNFGAAGLARSKICKPSSPAAR